MYQYKKERNSLSKNHIFGGFVPNRPVFLRGWGKEKLSNPRTTAHFKN